ncbi:MAG: hypothetical protein HQL97_16565 [Magnetococcales bacterium]|nr:hypothetical protein [Magnetococcales bacterium]
MSTPDWLPNWRNPSEYPGPKSPIKVFAWEFLRRNQKYQVEYNEIVKEIHKTTPENIVDFIMKKSNRSAQ